jgi:recombination protein RecT
MPTPDSKPSTQITPYQAKVATIRSLLDKMKPQIALALPKHMNPDRLLRIALTSIAKTPKLLECSQQSLAAACLQAAQIGLEPDGILGYAYLVPYKGTATLIPGYKGLLDLARRSGRIISIEARVVHAKDQFRFAFGLKPVLEHMPNPNADSGTLLAAYAVAHLRDGGAQWEVMWKREIDAIRARSRAADDGPWVTDYEEMAKKTVLRRLCKMLPASVELQQAVAMDERAEIGLAPMEILDLDALTPTGPSKLEELTATLLEQDADAPRHVWPPPPMPPAERDPTAELRP